MDEVATVTEFELRVVKVLADNPDWRYGQTYFNVLYELRPHLSEKIRATDVDPFYDDRIVPKTKLWLREHWEDPVPEGFVKPTVDDLIENAFKKAWG